MTARILVVEDDRTVAEVLIAYLNRAGYEVEWSADGVEALERWKRTSPDVVILDLMLPGFSGLEILRRRRRTGDHAAVIVLSARGEEEDRLVGLETGADDYVVKPFSPREVVLRVEALMRRTERLAGSQLLNQKVDLGDLHVDVAARSARLVQRKGDDPLEPPQGVAAETRIDRNALVPGPDGGRELQLTTREFDLLAFLAVHPGQTFSKQELLRRVWGWDFGDTSTVTVHVRRLREKVELDPSDPKIVLTVGRSGYRMALEGELP